MMLERSEVIYIRKFCFLSEMVERLLTLIRLMQKCELKVSKQGDHFTYQPITE